MNFEDKIKEIYSKIEPLECQGLCYNTCGIIPVSKLEIKHIEQKTRKPIPKTGGLDCPYLKNQKCSIYEDRPAICRLFGVTRKLHCEHGCRPQRWMTDEEVEPIFKELGLEKFDKTIILGR